MECQGLEPTPISLRVWLSRLRANSETLQLVTLRKTLKARQSGISQGCSSFSWNLHQSWFSSLSSSLWSLPVSCCRGTAAMPVHCLPDCQKKIFVWLFLALATAEIATSIMCLVAITFESASLIPYWPGISIFAGRFLSVLVILI